MTGFSGARADTRSIICWACSCSPRKVVDIGRLRSDVLRIGVGRVLELVVLIVNGRQVAVGDRVFRIERDQFVEHVDGELRIHTGINPCVLQIRFLALVVEIDRLLVAGSRIPDLSIGGQQIALQNIDVRRLGAHLLGLGQILLHLGFSRRVGHVGTGDRHENGRVLLVLARREAGQHLVYIGRGSQIELDLADRIEHVLGIGDQSLLIAIGGRILHVLGGIDLAQIVIGLRLVRLSALDVLEQRLLRIAVHSGLVVVNPFVVVVGKEGSRPGHQNEGQNRNFHVHHSNKTLCSDYKLSLTLTIRTFCVAGIRPARRMIRCPRSEARKVEKPEASPLRGSVRITYTSRMSG